MDVNNSKVKAFESLVRLYHNLLLFFFLRIGVAAADGEDLCQLTFLRIYKYRKSYTDSAKFTTYLYMIARQVRVDQIREKVRQGKVTDALKRQVTFNEAQPYHRPEYGLADDLQLALSKLSEAHREVVVLGMLQDMPYQEVAKILGVPLGTIKSRMHHALRQLKELLEK